MPDVLLPKWGLSMKEATVIAWLKHPGDRVDQGEPLADVETDKVETTIESPVSGVLKEILVERGETVPVGTRLAVIE